MSVLCSRYANALFQAAEAKNELDGVRAAVAALHEALADDATRSFVLSRQIDKKTKTHVLLNATAHAPTTIHNLLKLVVDRAVEHVLPTLGEEFARIDRRRSGQARCLIEAARPITPEELEAIRLKLEAHFGVSLEIEVVEKPELIGGFRATVGAERIDVSVRKRLAELHTVLTRVAG